MNIKRKLILISMILILFIIGMCSIYSQGVIYSINNNKYKDSDNIEESRIELYENNKVVFVGEFLNNPIILPPNTKTSFCVDVKSYLNEKLVNIKPYAGCSCTNVNFNDNLDVDQIKQIKFSYDSTGRRGNELIKMRLISAETNIFDINIKVYITDNQSDIYLSYQPQVINFDETWKSINNKEFNIDILNKIPIFDLRVKSSASYINALLGSDKSQSDNNILIVSLKDPPTGAINESVSIFYSLGKYEYESIIPINGTIKKTYYAQPAIANIGKVFDRENADTIINILLDQECSEVPEFSSVGDWEINTVEKMGDTKYSISMSLKSDVLSEYCSGKLIVKSVESTPLSVPIFATLANITK